MSDVAGWLKALGLERYADTFQASEIDIATLRHLSDADLRELGLPLGPRRKILAALEKPESPAALAPKEDPQSESERRHITVLFADIVNSTIIATQTDPEAMGALLKSFQLAVSAEIEGAGGHVAKFMGDAVLAYFGWPTAHEDAAERALRAGLGIVRAVARLREASGRTMHSRVGIASGLVVIGEIIGSGLAREESIAGETPHLAARLQSLADPDCVLISEATHRLVGRLFDCDAQGEHSLKGFSVPVAVWRVRGESARETRFSAVRQNHPDFFGRGRQLRLLRDGWAKTVAGSGSVFMVSGEAGIGKSRLIEALQETLTPDHRRVVWQCSPNHGNSAFHPVIRQIETAAGITAEEPDSQKLEKLRTLLASADVSDEDSVSLIAELLSIKAGHRGAADLAPGQRKAALIAAVAAWVAGQATYTPFLLVLEDAHWSDPSTQELMTRLIATVAAMRVMIMVTARPNFPAPWIGRPHVMVLTLDRLTQADSESMVQAIVAQHEFDPGLMQEVITKSDGNPLFLEELTRAVLESSARGVRAVPDTLQDTLMARLDILGTAKEVAQLASVIGRRFSLPLLKELSPRSLLAISADISSLISDELVYPVGAELYEFKHALLRDAAYESLLLARRRDIHGRIAHILEQRFAASVEHEPELLAYHFAQGGDPLHASQYSEKAGDRAVAQVSHAEAIASFRAALAQNALLPQSDDTRRRELRLLIKLGPPLSIIRGGQDPEVRDVYRRASEIARKFDDIESLFKAVWGLWYNANLDREMEEARCHAEELVALSSRSQDEDHVLEALHCRWSSALFRGDAQNCATDAAKGILLYDAERHHELSFSFGGHDPGVCAYGVEAMAKGILGFPEEARHLAEQGLVLADKLDHPHSVAHCLWSSIVTSAMARDTERALQLSRRMCEVSEKYKFPPYHAIGSFFQAWAVAHGTQTDEGVRQMEAAYPRAKALGPMQLICTAVMAEGLMAARRAADALQVLDMVLSELKFPKLGLYLPELHRIRGEALVALGAPNSEAALSSFDTALDFAKSQKARVLELRALISLVESGVARDAKDAISALGACRAEFSEGFCRPDLVKADAMLKAAGYA